MINSSRPSLILFCGLPGAGKTTTAHELEAAGRGIRLCTDDWQAALEVPHEDVDFHERLQERLYRLCGELLMHGQNVILEDGLWMKSERDEKRQTAATTGAATEMHYLDIPFEILWSRIEQRNNANDTARVAISKHKLLEYWNLFEKPTDAEKRLYDEFVVHRAE